MIKKNALRALLVFFIHQFTFTQSGWFWLNPLPQGNFLNSVSYVNNSIVYVSGAGGTLMKSTNGGFDFAVIPTGLRDNLSMYFINELTGFSPSGSGLLRTANGGTYWQYFQIPSDYETGGMKYIPNSTLFVLKNFYYGAYLYKSTDLGETWNISLTSAPNTVINSFHFADQSTG